MARKKTDRLTSDVQLQIKDVPLELLLLDADNPRLASGAGGNLQKELLRVLWNEMAVDELALSIAANGFFRYEPLFVIPQASHETENVKYVVLDGNRRLAAVLLLRDDKLREELRAADLPKLSVNQKAKLATLPVLIFKSREALWEYLGFHHINGPQPWDSFSKAQYVAHVYENYDVPLEKFAGKIGDRHATVKRLYRGYNLLQQAESMAGFDKEDRVRNRFYFSHLYTAADQPEFQKFLGIDADKLLRPNSVPRSKLAELQELMIWLYGSKSAGKEPVVHTQNPDLNILREVISKPNARAALRAGFSLERAHEIGMGDKRRFREALTGAKEELQQAKGTVTTGYSGEEDLYAIIEDILLYAETIKAEMETKRKKSPHHPRKN